MSKIADTNQANTMLSDTSLGIYTYCLARTPVSFPHTITGIDGVHEVYSVEQEGIFAVLSHVSLKEYNEETLEKNMTDVALLIPRAKRHEEVIEFVMTHATLNQHVNPDSPLSPPLPISSSFSTGQHTPVVPLRFCTIYKNQEGLFKTIMPHKEKILNFLDYTV